MSAKNRESVLTHFLAQWPVTHAQTFLWRRTENADLALVSIVVNLKSGVARALEWKDGRQWWHPRVRQQSPDSPPMLRDSSRNANP